MLGLVSEDTIRKEHGQPPADWWIEFKTELAAGEMRRLRRTFIKVDGAGQLSVATDDPEQYGWNLIKVGVTAWSFDTPISDEGIARLPDRVVTQIVQDLNEQYKPASAEKNEQ